MKRFLFYFTLVVIFGIAGAVPGTPNPTPQSVVEAFKNKYSSINDYQCRMWEYCYKGKEYEERIINFYFKRPRYIRMDILKGNRFADNGSRGVYLNDGKVRGRKGGILGFISITVDKHDSLATTIRGLTFDQSDMQATLEKMEFHLTHSSCNVNQSPGIYELVFVPRNPEENDGVTKDVIYLDSVTLLPIKSDSFEGERIVQHAEWTNYIINAGLPDELFDVYWNPARLVKMGIPTVHTIPP